MGQGASQEEADATGYRVLGVQPGSPASAVGLVSFFDFVVACDGVELRELDSTFIDKIKGSEDVPLPCSVYNLKSRRTRDVHPTGTGAARDAGRDDPTTRIIRPTSVS